MEIKGMLGEDKKELQLLSELGEKKSGQEREESGGQEAQKRLDHILQTEAMKREATEQKLQEQMAGMSTEMQEQMLGLNGKYDHLTTTLATIQLQL
ncbi:hypothetical protein DH2020_042188 [Rehmannia glutinosa]|uniref:Uncharacterized protein n=1 Tax=Rehmannia glutinosa TaxID=99300 RepID=A0ABR0UN57_REHGL